MKCASLLLLLAASMFGQDLSGTYTGTLKAETGQGTQDAPGTIVLKQSGEKLSITAGPQPDQQLPGTKIVRDGGNIKFEINPPGDTPRTMLFDINVKDGKLTGKVTLTREGEVRHGQLDLVKQ